MSRSHAQIPTSFSYTRRYPIGAEVAGNEVSFRVWAPRRRHVGLMLENDKTLAMKAEADGYFRLDLGSAANGTLYRFVLDGVSEPAADPASRFQPDGLRGWSRVVDHTCYEWQDKGWKGVRPDRQILYELHIGTFTPEGTYHAAAGKLASLKDIGITCLEIMPLNEFSGDFGWGYDGALPYAPTRLYGEPDDLRAFIDAAHAEGIGVILDIVYNHFGLGDRFRDFCPDYFTERHSNEWGSSINFDGENSAGVRAFFASNARYWIDEYHFDGLRLDATQALNDGSDEHIIAVVGREARAAAPGRSIYLVAENEPQDCRLVRPPCDGGYGLDALWNDDFHHSAMVALSGKREAYYHDHGGQPQEFVSAAKYGYLFQGQRYDWQDAARGRPALDTRADQFIHFLQNHDQIANSGTGQRIDKLASPARLRAMTALLLLGPQTPMLFQGQEFGASAPFNYFADHPGELGEVVRQGRIDFLRQFPSLCDPEFERQMALPSARTTFETCKLDWGERAANSMVVDLHRDLIALRNRLPATEKVDGSVLGDQMFLLRFFATAPENERILIINLGTDAAIVSAPEPLLAPPDGLQWEMEWSSEDLKYGGRGKRPLDLQSRSTISGECAVLCRPIPGGRRSIPEHEKLMTWQQAISRRIA
jgi:maltooligosyltrehalose trehalohydrolase